MFEEFAAEFGIMPEKFYLLLSGIAGVSGLFIMGILDLWETIKEQIRSGEWEEKPVVVVYSPNREVRAKYFRDRPQELYLRLFFYALFALSLLSLVIYFSDGIGIPFPPAVAGIITFACTIIIVLGICARRFKVKSSTRAKA